MAKKGKNKAAEQETFVDNLNEIAAKSENFLEKNAKILSIIFGVILVAAIGYVVYLKNFKEPKEQKAMQESLQANIYFQQDSLAKAYDGSAGAYSGYKQIIENYNGTPAANLAKLQAAICTFHSGDFQKSYDYAKDFDANEATAKVMKFGVLGDAASELKKYDEAFDNYIKAAESSDLEASQNVYYNKAVQLAVFLTKKEQIQEAVEKWELVSPNNPEAMKWKAYVENM